MATRTVFWLRTVLLSATLLGLLSCWPLWFNAREFPVLPITSWFPVLAPPLDKVWFGAMIVSLPLAAWRYRPAVIFFGCKSVRVVRRPESGTTLRCFMRMKGGFC